MSTTTIRLPDELKARIQVVARSRGLSAHALILEAIAEKAETGERRMEFYECADARLAGIAETGKTIAWKDMRAYLKARAAAQSASQPIARKFAG